MIKWNNYVFVIFILSFVLGVVSTLFSNILINELASRAITVISIFSGISIALITVKIHSVSKLDHYQKRMARKIVVMRLAYVYFFYFLCVAIWFNTPIQVNNFIIIILIKTILWYSIYISLLIVYDFVFEFL